MPTKKQSNISPAFPFYEKLIHTTPEVELKGDTMPYTSVNGNMFSFLSKEGIAGVRLAEKDREAFLKKYSTTLFEAYGTVLKEYVAIPDTLLKNTKELKKYFALSYVYAKTLKSKPTKKKPAAKAKKK
jgi:TfoX/Sxy family transcriptional regulator of competence genes